MIGERNSSLPLPLLIIIGKSRGEGDYYNYENKKLVGTWCDSISYNGSKNELGYGEVHLDFCY